MTHGSQDPVTNTTETRAISTPQNDVQKHDKNQAQQNLCNVRSNNHIHTHILPQEDSTRPGRQEGAAALKEEADSLTGEQLCRRQREGDSCQPH